MFNERGGPGDGRSTNPSPAAGATAGADGRRFAVGASDPIGGQEPGPGGLPGAGPTALADRLDGLVLRFELWRERPVVVWGLLALVVSIAALGWWLARPVPSAPVEDLLPLAGADPDGGGDGPPNQPPPTPSAAPTTSPQPSAVAADLIVHVIGEVNRPGLVELAPGSRIVDAVAAAGGVTEAADPDRLNFAAPVADGSQVRVPAINEEVDGPLVVAARSAGDDPSVGPADTTGPIDLNTATGEQLETLPGVGPATAAAIIAWRSDNGGFLTVDDLTSVPGIGPAKLAALRDLVTV